MLVLDWDKMEAEVTNPHRLLGRALNRIDQLELMQAPPEEKLIWINDTIERFKESKLQMNETIKGLFLNFAVVGFNFFF